MHGEGPAEIYVALDRFDAQMVLDHLVRHGIRARMVGADLRDTAGGEVGLGALSAPTIWAPAAQEAEARQLVEAYEAERRKTRDDPAEAWRCPSCGETVEGGFDLCWSCETPRGTPATDGA